MRSGPSSSTGPIDEGCVNEPPAGAPRTDGRGPRAADRVSIIVSMLPRARFAVMVLLVVGCGRGRTDPPAVDDAGAVVAAPVAPVDHPAATWEDATRTAGTHWPVDARRQAVEAGVAVIKQQQCTRCHEVDGLPGVGRPFDCASCHVFLLGLKPGERRYEDIAKNNGRDVLERYQRNIRHLIVVPKLTGIARRVRPDWLATFLAAPFDLRPLLDESMIRYALAPDDLRALVRYFAAVADTEDPFAAGWRAPALPPPPSAARLADGQARFTNLGCGNCHTFGNLVFAPGMTPAFYETMRASAAQAPNLRFARDRLRPEVIVDWILDPASISPGSSMPKLGVSRADAELIRDFLLYAPVDLPAAPPAEPLLAMPPPVDRAVGWAEVKERVLGNVCVHCHMNDHEKDVGAGNIGGFGYPGKGLALRTYDMAMRGARGADGVRYSVFTALPGEAWPRILQVLVTRRVENRRDHLAPLADADRPPFGADLLGMPLGLPAMTDEEIGILRRWIDDGCPGPTAVTGKPGFTDGYLVPDGPVRQNRGCKAREPQEPPPTWATRPSGKPPGKPPGKPSGKPSGKNDGPPPR